MIKILYGISTEMLKQRFENEFGIHKFKFPTFAPHILDRN